MTDHVTARLAVLWAAKFGRRVREATLRQWAHREPELRTKRVAGITLYHLGDVQRYAKEGPWSVALDDHTDVSHTAKQASRPVGEHSPDDQHQHGDSCEDEGCCD